MANELHDKLLRVLKDRTTWESRQRVWYQMRNDGLPRRRKPFPGAADLHYPLIDEAIEKLTPFYYQQVYSSPRTADFVALTQQPAETAEAAADYADWNLKHETDFETQVLAGIDLMLERGRGILKLRWDPLETKVCVETVDPLYLIVPKCKRLEDADYFAHVQIFTRGQYERDRRFVQGPHVMERICGKGEQHRPTESEDAVEDREGVTWSNSADEIVVWEVYQKTPGGWTVHTYSPTAPSLPLRRPFGLTVKWKGKPLLPFITRLVMEVKEGDWYAPRGVSERLAAFETYLTKTWNEKADAMTFYNRPIFTGATALPNTANLTFRPGEYFPNDLKKVEMGQAPVSFDLEMQQTRQIANERIHMPDAATAPPLNAAGGKKGFPTATQVDYERALASTGVDLKGRIFRLGLRDLYVLHWAILLQHRRENLTYFVSAQLKTLPPQALSDAYLVEPAGSTDAWNKGMNAQRAGLRYDRLRGHPNINQEELVRDVVATDDPRLVKRLFMPSGLKAATEAEDEASEILLLQAGYPAAVTPAEDHALRIRILFGKLEQLTTLGVPVDPIFQQRIQQHLQQHLQYLLQQNPQLARQIMQAVQVADPGVGNPQAPIPNDQPGGGEDAAGGMGEPSTLNPQPSTLL